MKEDVFSRGFVLLIYIYIVKMYDHFLNIIIWYQLWMILPKSCTPFLYNIMASGPLLNVEQDSYCILVQVSGSW